MKKSMFLVMFFLVFTIASASLATTTMYTSESSFLSAINPGYYLEDFGAFTYGSFYGPSLDFGPVNGFSYTMSSPGGLYSLDSCMSTNLTEDPINITFTGSDVTAVGGLFWPTDYDGANIIGNILLSLSNGTIVNLVDADLSTFRGFVSDGAAFISMSISAPDNTQWPTVDNLYVGESIPAPGAILLGSIGVGLVGWFRRKRVI